MSRTRITITIKAELLRSLDTLIDGVRIKNRSHAVEALLYKSLTERRIRQAVILAGGRGVYLGGQKGAVSRVLALHQNKPLVEHVFRYLESQGIEKVILCGGEYSRQLQQEIGSGERFGLDISYLDKDEGTASVLRHLINRIDTTFLMVNGDVLCKAGLEEMFEFHKRCQGVCTVGMISVPKPAAFGNIVLKGNRILDFIEKPRAGAEESYLVNAGIYIMEPEIFNLVSPRYSSLEKDLFPALARSNRLYGYFLQERWASLGTMKGAREDKESR